MQESGRVAIARVVLRSKEQLVAIRPDRDGTVLMMETMIFADEVVPKDDLDGLPDAEELKVSEREVAMAQQLIESLVERLRARALQGRVPREGARADRAQGRGRGDHRRARGARAGQGAGPDGGAGGQPRRGAPDDDDKPKRKSVLEGVRARDRSKA